jgi:hypothetical protein
VRGRSEYPGIHIAGTPVRFGIVSVDSHTYHQDTNCWALVSLLPEAGVVRCSSSICRSDHRDGANVTCDAHEYSDQGEGN